MTDLKPGWCILHPGEREPCRKCNSTLRRLRSLGALVAIGLVLTACKPDPHAPTGEIGDGIPATTQTPTPVPVPTP